MIDEILTEPLMNMSKSRIFNAHYFTLENDNWSIQALKHFDVKFDDECFMRFTVTPADENDFNFAFGKGNPLKSACVGYFGCMPIFEMPELKRKAGISAEYNFLFDTLFPESYYLENHFLAEIGNYNTRMVAGFNTDNMPLLAKALLECTHFDYRQDFCYLTRSVIEFLKTHPLDGLKVIQK